MITLRVLVGLLFAWVTLPFDSWMARRYVRRGCADHARVYAWIAAQSARTLYPQLR